jgi:predicted acetyltransferase
MVRATATVRRMPDSETPPTPPGRAVAVEPARLDDVEPYARGAASALRIDPASGFDAFLDVVGIERLRVVRESGRPIAGAASIAAAQLFGGRAVPSALVTAVWVAPAARGRGVASGLVEALNRELRAEGFPISALYPANLALYRRAGYETAGANQVHVARLDALDPRGPGGWRVEALEGLTPQAPGPLAALHEAARPHLGAGTPVRGPALWHSLLRWTGGGESAAFLARSPAGEPRGHLVLDTRHTSSEISVRELLGLEPDATRALLAHLAGYRGIFETARWPGGAFDPTAHLLRGGPTRTQAEPLMIAVLDPAAALAARGYPAGLTARLELDVEGAGPLVLELDGSGTGQVAPGGAGAIRLGGRALAPLYTGFAGPRTLAITGGIDAPGDAVAALEAAFAGPAPWLVDRF